MVISILQIGASASPDIFLHLLPSRFPISSTSTSTSASPLPFPSLFPFSPEGALSRCIVLPTTPLPSFEMKARLSGGHFRMINEKLYTCTWPHIIVPTFKIIAAECLQKIQIGE
ncbi:hypothetical protein AAHE18_13G193600 [Arachis hypogaea]